LRDGDQYVVGEHTSQRDEQANWYYVRQNNAGSGWLFDEL